MDDVEAQCDLAVFAEINKRPFHSGNYRVGPIPTVLTTSQKLSTGVDARNVRNIVLMRPVNDMIEFKQIVGRGTRMFDGKDYFTIYDFVNIFDHFADPEWADFLSDPTVIRRRFPS